MKSIQQYFASRTERERQILILGTVFGLPLLIWLALWQPMLQARASGEEKLLQRRQTYEWMQQSAATIKANQGGAKTVASGSPQQKITAAAAQHTITLTRIEPMSNGRYTLWVSAADYNSAVHFVDALLRAGLTLESLSMNQLDVPGTVSLRASFGGGQ
ncbi:type II secretion system protein M [Spongiibacter sp. KMU-158]|uniref:Type II secretion system protein M n=1 Tax=Spongiibacter pelagi TaxID=2760804 RepID=A0A927BZP8_9GAMM|nr:type II secretion system protein M [Spongiibacter pelagi]MBD2858555.1 type II secretion system protein M [Spongiibacter pelagi]